MHPHSAAGGGETFFVNSYAGSGNALCLWTLTGDRTSSPTLVSSSVSTWRYDSIGENVDQPDVADDIDGGDVRVLNGVYAQRKAFVTLTTDPDDDGTMAGAYVAKLDVDSASRRLAAHSSIPLTTTTSTRPSALPLEHPADPNIALFMSYTGPSAYASGAVKVYTNHPTDGYGAVLGHGRGPELLPGPGLPTTATAGATTAAPSTTGPPGTSGAPSSTRVAATRGGPGSPP